MNPRYQHPDSEAVRRCLSAPYQDLTTAIRHYREALCRGDAATVELLRGRVQELIRSYA
jgi:hypothetical protein